MDAIEKRARELLAAEYERFDLPSTAAGVREGAYDLNPAMRALVAALTPPNGCALASAARDALPFVAYAFDQGIDGAAEVGRAIEEALRGNQPGGYVLVPSGLLRMVAGCAYPVSSEIDSRGYRWSEAYLDEVLPSIKAALAADYAEADGV